MKIVNSFFVKFENGTCAWLAVGNPVPADAELVEVRPMLVPEDGMVLRNIETGVESTGHWLREDDSAEKWEEIDELKENMEK